MPRTCVPVLALQYASVTMDDCWCRAQIIIRNRSIDETTSAAPSSVCRARCTRLGSARQLGGVVPMRLASDSIEVFGVHALLIGPDGAMSRAFFRGVRRYWHHGTRLQWEGWCGMTNAERPASALNAPPQRSENGLQSG
jgi:hypothetical protein